MRVLIAGAGIGGLTAALCLQKAGYEVYVFEQTQTFEQVGAGIQCGANALRVLEYLGLLEQLKSIAVEPERIQFRDYSSGEALHTIELGQRYQSRYGAPYYHLHRADLIQVLVEALQLRAPDSLHLNTAVLSYQENINEVRVTLSDGQIVEGDCLLGADGIRSRVRAQLLGDHKPEFTGNVAWRGVVPVERLPNDWMDTITSNFVGPNKHLVTYYLRQQQLANLVGVVENSDWTDDSWVVKAPWEELQADFAGWHSTVQAIIGAMDKDQCFRWALYRHQPFKNWSSERVTLMGDAAHATLPFMASGAAMAIEDARVLERALTDTQTVSKGLLLYQANRLARTARVQQNSSRAGMLYHIENRFLRQAAFSAMSLVAKYNETYLSAYDANTVPLN